MGLVLEKAQENSYKKIGVFNLPGRKRPYIGIQEGGRLKVYGQFSCELSGEEFMIELGKFLDAEIEVE